MEKKLDVDCAHCGRRVLEGGVVQRQFTVYMKSQRSIIPPRQMIRMFKCLCTGPGGHGQAEAMLIEAEGYRMERSRRPD